MTSAEIRQQFLNFFESKGHTIVPSASIVVKNDPTLLFTNAGMNQFKEYFLGNKQPLYTRVADTQKCLRVSGKHNDLEEVGVDTYHHTMFEMLGNWSFGDYFKKEAIAWSWELLTEVYKLDKDRLYVTVFQGDEKEGLAKDEEALNEWKKYVSEDRILPGNKKDNFWEMGDTGPCGPCTEIHVDCRSDEERKAISGASLVNNDHPQVIEIWNNVFMQFNRQKDGSLEPLPAKHVDTGMGFERLVRVIQGKQSNYDTDVFTGTIAAIEKITNKQYDFSDSKQAVAFRVLADHIRAIAFTIADGQLPSNTGAGYVIRRILRRAVRYYYSYLDYKQPLLFQLLPVLAKQFEEVFSSLYLQLDFVSKVAKEEEDAFLRTLEKGITRFENYVKNQTSVASSQEDLNKLLSDRWDNSSFINKKVVAGQFAFELNDTYGFPIDLTELMAREINWTVDLEGYNQALQQQKSRSRAATAIDTEDWVVLDDIPSSEFVGYEKLQSYTVISKYRKATIKGKTGYQIVLLTTPFYAESGGQVGDTGVLEIGGEEIKVFDTKKENDLIIQFTEQLPEKLRFPVVAKVDKSRRQNIASHHSATHLLHAALRKVLGTHVAQKGSLVNDEQLRFDFSHFAKVTDEEVAKIEAIVNEKIRENIAVVIKQTTKDEAVKEGAMALFGEKYGDIVRMVIIDPNYSVELCGGTHIGASGELGFFKIKHESAVAAGVRRIEAVTGKAAEDYINGQLADLDLAKAALKNPKQLSKSIDSLLAEQSELKKKLESMEAKLLNSLEQELLVKATTVNGIAFIGEIVELNNADGLKKLANDLAKKTQGAVVLCAAISGKASVAIALAETVTAKGLDAAAIIKQQVAAIIKGGGGGNKTLATAGGQNTGDLQQVIEKVKGLL